MSVGYVLEKNNPAHGEKNRNIVVKQHVIECLPSLATAIGCRLVTNAIILEYSPYSHYFDSNDFTVTWALADALFMLVVYDFFFYFFHRALHTKYLYTRFHKQHQKIPTTAFSTNTSSLLEIGGNVVLLHIPKYFLPFHETFHHVMLFIVAVCSSMAHDSHFDIFNHQKHHEKNNVNYSTFLPIWDTIMGTRWTK